MDHRQLLSDAARRPLDTAEVVLDGISSETLHAMPEGKGNSIAWLVWHAARQMDVQLAHLAHQPQVWDTGGWAEKLGLDHDADSFGLGDDRDAVASLRIDDPRGLRDYLSAVVHALRAYVRQVSAPGLDAIVDRSWDPPTTRGVRLVSIIDDAVAHLGQAAYVRGLVEDWRIGY